MFKPIRKAAVSGPLALALAAGLALPAAAQGRYGMEPTDSGYVRMDTQTGEMSVCRLRGEQMVCQMAADDRTALMEALEELEARVAVLERRLNVTAPDAIERDGLPSEEEFERGLGYMEEFMRRFMGIVEEFEERDGRT